MEPTYIRCTFESSGDVYPYTGGMVEILTGPDGEGKHLEALVSSLTVELKTGGLLTATLEVIQGDAQTKPVCFHLQKLDPMEGWAFLPDWKDRDVDDHIAAYMRRIEGHDTEKATA